MNIIQLPIAIILFLVLFFGIGFLINMLLKTTWLPSVVLYPIVLLIGVSEVSIFQYFVQPINSFAHLGEQFGGMPWFEYLILASGWIGAIGSGMTIKTLRVRGYQMF